MSEVSVSKVDLILALSRLLFPLALLTGCLHNIDRSSPVHQKSKFSVLLLLLAIPTSAVIGVSVEFAVKLPRSTIEKGPLRGKDCRNSTSLVLVVNKNYPIV